MRKKGITQVDWAISLAIFLLYLAWFFLYTKPLYEPSSRLDPLADIVGEKVLDNATWSLEQIPIIIDSNYSDTAVPIFVTLLENWSAEDVHIPGRYFYFDNSSATLIFLEDLQDTDHIITLTHSQKPGNNFIETMPTPSISPDVKAGKTTLSELSFRADFKNSILGIIRYNQTNLVRGQMKYYVKSSGFTDFEEINDFSYSWAKSPIFGKYMLNDTTTNVTTFIFSNNTMAINKIKFLSTAQNTNRTFRTDFRLHNFSKYYVSQSENRLLDYTTSDCRLENVTTRFIDFYDDQYTGLGIISDTPMDIDFCTDSNDINISVRVISEDEAEIRFIAHDGDWSNILKEQDFHYTHFGMESTKRGMGLHILESFNTSLYEDYKTDWGYLKGREFQIEAYNSSQDQIFNFSAKDSSDQYDIFNKEYYNNLLDEYGNLESIRVFIRVW